MITPILSRDSSVGTVNVSTDGRITLIITSITTITGTCLILALAYISYAIFRRRQQATLLAFEAARLRDPTLTWEEHARRRRFTHSRLLLEEELQRSTIIRKSLQSRTSVANDQERGSNQSVKQTNDSTTELGDGDDELLLSARRGEGNQVDQNTYSVKEDEVLSGKQWLSASRDNSPIDEDGESEPRPPTAARLKLAPLLVHPALRRPFPPRNSSLPTELAQVRPLPLH
ncbi:hypothetical protein GGR54DRAFT_605275 [Hypoxylon sp. NC1633]|nr:hypothetical protein GGR54DRAFT_605275 [Hypoxylon sp. NC1633]